MPPFDPLDVLDEYDPELWADDGEWDSIYAQERNYEAETGPA